MSLRSVVSVSPDALCLGRVLAPLTDYEAEVHEVIPTGEEYLPYVWVEHGDQDRVKSVFADSPLVSRVRRHTSEGGRGLYRLWWRGPLDAFVESLLSTDCPVTTASGDASGWTFELEPDSESQLAALRTAWREAGLDVEICSVLRSPPERAGRAQLTDRQSEILRLAHERGYFNVPRETTISELATELDISPQAASKLLRRGLDSALGGLFDTPDQHL